MHIPSSPPSTAENRGIPLHLTICLCRQRFLPRNVSSPSTGCITDVANLTRTRVDVARTSNQIFRLVLLSNHLRLFVVKSLWIPCEPLLEKRGLLQEGSNLGGPPKDNSFNCNLIFLFSFSFSCNLINFVLGFHY